ncbi:MAG: ABC transporter substrate-binding protein [Silicimonas sp.]|nr:ABC transporter substrate-binding protein [Silicimonas sp.]
MSRRSTRAIAIARSGETAQQSARRVALATLLGLCVVATAAGIARGESHEDITISHAYTNFGEPKYGPDFTHLDYVNPDAPKGGEYSTWAQGNFDSFNPWTRKGVAAFPFGDTESILTGTADDPYGVYCYLCTTLEYPESKDWVIFNLRDDVVFSDGTPVDAEDAEFTFDYFMDQGLPEFVARVSSYVTDVEVLDTYRIKYTFSPDAPRRDVVSFAGGLPILSEDQITANDKRLDEPTLEPFMGTGPYVIDSFDPGRQIIYGRNPNWWAADHPFNVGRFNFDTIRIEYFSDSTAALEAFKAGEFLFKNENSSKDWATAYDFPKLNDGTIIKEEVPDGSIGSAQAWVFNLRREAWQDPDVREAARLMFNFEWSNQTLFYDLYERVNSFLENSDLEATGTPSEGELAILEPLVADGLLPEAILTDEVAMSPESGPQNFDRKNLRRASRLLEGAGWEIGDDGKRRKDGQVLTLDILSFSPTFDRIINPFVENLNRVGIDAKLDRVDIAQYQERRRNGDWDLVNHTFSMTFEPGDSLKQWYASITAEDSSRNLMYLKDPAVDRLIDTVVEARTLEDLTTATHALDRVLRSYGFWVPQWFKDVHTVAYYDVYRHPDPLPPYSLGDTDLWWWDAGAAERLKAQGAF